MTIQNFIKTIKNGFEVMMQRMGRREKIIISSVVLAAILAIILIAVFKNGPADSTSAEDGSDIQMVSEEALSGDMAQNAAAVEEELPVVETATEGMKAESTPDTTVLARKEGAKDGYLNRCVFLGDSRTVAMVNYGFFNDDAALAQIGISHPSFASNTFVNNAGREYTLKSYLASHQAPVIYILLGVNGINDPSEDHYKKTFIKLIDSVAGMAPNSNLVLVAIGPVDDNGAYRKNVQNAWIDKYNAFLLETAKEKHIFYLDIAEILKGSDGQVRSEYNGGDGLHYSGKGCEAIFRYLVEHPVPGISDEGEYVVRYIKPDPNRTRVSMGEDSGIDEEKLKDLMNMMMGNAEEQTVSDTDTQNTQGAEEEQRNNEEEEENKEAEEEAKKKVEEEERKKAEEEEENRKKEEEKRKKEEEEKKRKEEEARKQAEEEARRNAAEEEARRNAAEEEARRNAAEEEARRKAEEEEASRKAEEEEARRKAEEEEARRKAEEEEARRKAEEEEENRKGEEEEEKKTEEGEEKKTEEGEEKKAEETGEKNEPEAGKEQKEDGENTVG